MSRPIYSVPDGVLLLYLFFFPIFTFSGIIVSLFLDFPKILTGSVIILALVLIFLTIGLIEHWLERLHVGCGPKEKYRNKFLFGWGAGAIVSMVPMILIYRYPDDTAITFLLIFTCLPTILRLYTAIIAPSKDYCIVKNNSLELFPWLTFITSIMGFLATITYEDKLTIQLVHLLFMPLFCSCTAEFSVIIDEESLEQIRTEPVSLYAYVDGVQNPVFSNLDNHVAENEREEEK